MSHTTRTEHLPSSHGTHSRVVKPKDVSPHDATAKDFAEREIASSQNEEREEELLDDAVDLTFPASDPIAVSQATKKDENGNDITEESSSKQRGKSH
jgi:hypothetical protein